MGALSYADFALSSVGRVGRARPKFGTTLGIGAFSKNRGSICHPERSEGSSLNASQILRFAQNDGV